MFKDSSFPLVHSPNQSRRQAWVCCLATAAFVLANLGELNAQTWTLLPANPLGSTNQMNLLPNGTVIVQGLGTGTGHPSAKWTLLKPDKAGNYATGSWATATSMRTPRANFSSWVVPSGNFVVAGGEFETYTYFYYYFFYNYYYHYDVEIYNPNANSWSQSKSPSPLNYYDSSGYFFGSSFGNPPSMLLPSGQILFGDVGGIDSALYDPVQDAWTSTGNVLGTFSSSEGQSYTLMPDGTVLSWPIQYNLSATLPPSWRPGTNYALAVPVLNKGNFYLCTSAGTSGNGQGPTGKGFNFQDGSATWAFLPPWQPNTNYLKGQAVYVNNGAFICVAAGTSGAVGGSPPANKGTALINTIQNYPVYFDGSVLWDALHEGSFSYIPPVAQIYNSGTGNWTKTGTANVVLTDSSYVESTRNIYTSRQIVNGPSALMPDGTVIQFGANGNTAIYDTTKAVWSLGPTFTPGLGPDGVSGAMLPNGQFLIAVDSAPGQVGSTKLYTYDYTQQALSYLDVTSIPALAADLAKAPATNRRMLILPNGHLLFNTGTGNIWDYNPGGQPLGSWRPTVASIQRSTSTNYTINGTRLTGISAGAWGCPNSTPATNFPIVTLTDTSGNVRFASTFGWVPGVSSPGDTTAQSVQVTLPTGLGVGTFNLSVIANGISSAAKQLVIAAPQPNFTTVGYDSKNQIISLTGDSGSNVVSLTLTNQVVTVAGGLLTQVQASQTATWPTNSNTVTLTSPNALVAVGMLVAGTGIPNGTLVTAISSNQTVLTLSSKTTAAGTTGAKLTFESVGTTQSGTWASGSTAVTLSAANTGIIVGMAVYGAGIPAGTTVQAISGTTLTLTQNPTAAGSNSLLTFGGRTLSIHLGTNLNLATSLQITGSFAGGNVSVNTGDDYVTLTGMSAQNVNMTFGAGNDTVKLFYSNINTLIMNGGQGSNIYGTAASKIGNGTGGLTNFTTAAP